MIDTMMYANRQNSIERNEIVRLEFSNEREDDELITLKNDAQLNSFSMKRPHSTM